MIIEDNKDLLLFISVLIIVLTEITALKITNDINQCLFQTDLIKTEHDYTHVQ